MTGTGHANAAGTPTITGTYSGNTATIVTPVDAVVTSATANTWQGKQVITDQSMGYNVAFAYNVYLPPGWSSTGTKWPVVVFADGTGSTGSDGVAQTANIDIIRSVSGMPAIVVAVQDIAPPYTPYTFPMERLAHANVHMAAALHAVTQYNGDPKRLHLTGLSGGAARSYFTLFYFGNVWASAAILSGDMTPYADAGAEDTAGAAAQFVTRPGANVPMRIYHAQDDSTVTVDKGRTMSAAIIAAGKPCTYIEATSGGHSQTYWNTIYGDITFWNWLTSYTLP